MSSFKVSLDIRRSENLYLMCRVKDHRHAECNISFLLCMYLYSLLFVFFIFALYLLCACVDFFFLIWNCQNKLPMGEFMHASELSLWKWPSRTRAGAGWKGLPHKWNFPGHGDEGDRQKMRAKNQRVKRGRETQGKQWECSQWNALKIENQWTVIITCRRVRNKHIHIYLTPHMCVRV